jgi:hypothetical protein
MTFDVLDQRLLCETHAWDALRLARKADNADARQAWLAIAKQWKLLAGVFREECSCGGEAAGAQYGDHGSRRPLCAAHLHQALMRGRRVRIGHVEPDAAMLSALSCEPKRAP